MVSSAFEYKQPNPGNTGSANPSGSAGVTPQATQAFRPGANPFASTVASPKTQKEGQNINGALPSALNGVIGGSQKAPTTATSPTTPTSTGGQSTYSGGNQFYNQPITQGNQTSGYNYLFGGQSPQDPINILLKQLSAAMYPMLGSQVQFAGQLEPQRQGDIQNYLNSTNPASQQAMVNTYGNQASQNANVGAQQSGALQRASGLGTGYQAGSLADAGQAAANAKNQYQAQVNSPQYQQQLLSSALGAIGQGQNLSGINQLQNMGNPLFQQEQLNTQSQGNGLWGGLMSTLGALGGGGGLSGLAGMFGGGSGGGGVNTSSLPISGGTLPGGGMSNYAQLLQALSGGLGTFGG
jgi:hypothetical protein